MGSFSPGISGYPYPEMWYPVPGPYPETHYPVPGLKPGISPVPDPYPDPEISGYPVPGFPGPGPGRGPGSGSG